MPEAVVHYISDAGYGFLEAKGNPGVVDATIRGCQPAVA